MLKNLEGCTVYLLDYSGEVEVTNVTSSQIFIGRALCYALCSSCPSTWQAKAWTGREERGRQKTRCGGLAGPVDGPAIFDKVVDCQVAVAAQQFQVRSRPPTTRAPCMAALHPPAVAPVAAPAGCLHARPAQGPGAAMADGCATSCAVCRQVRNSSNSEFGLYSATKPTIEHSSELRFTCWMGAYPGLTQHFEKANLDPKSNQWDKART